LKVAKKATWAVLGLGTAVAAMGGWLLRGRLKSGGVSFGLTRIILGTLDMLRPTMRR